MKYEKNKIEDKMKLADDMLETVTGGTADDDGMMTVQLECTGCGAATGIYMQISKGEYMENFSYDKSRLWVRGKYSYDCPECGTIIRRGVTKPVKQTR